MVSRYYDESDYRRMQQPYRHEESYGEGSGREESGDVYPPRIYGEADNGAEYGFPQRTGGSERGLEYGGRDRYSEPYRSREGRGRYGYGFGAGGESYGDTGRYRQRSVFGQYGLRSDSSQQGRGAERWSANEYQGERDASRQFDPDYYQWRNEQLSTLDDDYKAWRSERYQKFADEFSQWRAGRTRSDAGGQARNEGSGTKEGSGKGQ